MTHIELSLICTSSVATSGWIYTWYDKRRIERKFAASKDEVTKLEQEKAQLKTDLEAATKTIAGLEEKLQRFTAFIDSLESLLRKLARCAGDGLARTTFWKATALRYLDELKVQDIEKEMEATLKDLLATLKEALSWLKPQPNPSRSA
jgi:chromosome segregation ATPase